MSIIYNALQKTQKNLGNHRFQRREKIWFDILLSIIIAALLVMIVVEYYPTFKRLLSSSSTATIQHPSVQQATTAPTPHTVQAALVPAPEVEYQGDLKLNGVFLSNDEKVAMINNQPLHLGDVIDNKKVVSIELNKVKLQDKTNIFVLRAIS